MPTLIPPLLIVFAAGLGASLLLVPLVRTLARRWGLVDRPDGRRKLHRQPVPVSGGLAVLMASVLVLGLAAVVPGPLADALAANSTRLLGLLSGALIICAVGVADDCRLIRRRHKLLGQLAAAGIVVTSGIRIDSVGLFDYQLELGLLSLPVTLFWLLGAINALNLLDGMDGLLASVGGIISLTLGAMALMKEDAATAVVAVTLGGAALGFLRYNFPPASIFLGDCGSMLIGLVVGVLAIHSSLKGPTTVALVAPLALFTIPIFDTAAAILRRKLTGRSIYCTDRGHLHHCLLGHGMSNRVALLVVSSLSLVTVVGVLSSIAWRNEGIALVSAVAVIATLVLTRLFGYAEFELLQQRITSAASSFLSLHPGEVRQATARLRGSADWGRLWSRLIECAARLDLQSVCLDVNAPAIQEEYHAVWARGGDGEEGEGGSSVWRAEIPLSSDGQTVGRIEIAGRRGGESVSVKVAGVAHVVAEIEQAVSSLTVGRDTAGVPSRLAAAP